MERLDCRTNEKAPYTDGTSEDVQAYWAEMDSDFPTDAEHVSLDQDIEY